MVRAIAAPSGDALSLQRFQRAYVSHWQAALAARSLDAPAWSAAVARAAAGLETRWQDPLFMAWLHRLERAMDARETHLAELGPPLLSSSLPRVGRGRFLRIGAADCAELARMMTEPEVESKLPNEVIDRNIAESLDLLAAVWAEAMADVAAFARALLVLDLPRGVYNSGSDPAMPFILKVTCAPGAWPAILADSLVHETAHVKLRMAMRLTRFFEDDETPRFQHPWRSDARPLRGIVVAAHAFVSIFIWYARLAGHPPNADAAQKEAQKLCPEIATVLGTLAGAPGLTAVGRQLVACLTTQYEAECRRIRCAT